MTSRDVFVERHTGAVEYDTTLFQVGNNTGVPVPADVLESLGGGKRPAVVVRVNGYEYRSTVAPMGGQFLISFSADKRKETGLAGGDPISVELTIDSAPRTVEVPADLATALAAAGATASFDALAPSLRKAHVVSVSGAKTDATRERRVQAVVTKVTGV